MCVCVCVCLREGRRKGREEGGEEKREIEIIALHITKKKKKIEGIICFCAFWNTEDTLNQYSLTQKVGFKHYVYKKTDR